MRLSHKATRKKFKQAEPIRLDISPFRMKRRKTDAAWRVEKRVFLQRLWDMAI